MTDIPQNYPPTETDTELIEACECGSRADEDSVSWESVQAEMAEHDKLSYRLSYWFWLNVYRIQRRLGLMR